MCDRILGVVAVNESGRTTTTAEEMMARREFMGRSAAEAAIKACEELGISRSQLHYEGVSDSGEGLARQVIIAVDAEPGERASVPSAGSVEASEQPKREGARRDFARRESAGGRRRDRDRERGAPRREGARTRGRRSRSHETESDGGIDALLHLDSTPAEPPAVRPAVEGEPSPTAKRAADVLAEILKLLSMHVEGVRVEDGEEEVQFDLRGEDEKRIIGKKGDALLALQFVVNRMISREDSVEKRVILDAAGYRERRRSALADLAKRLAARALQEHKVVRLSPMSAHDRRIFHITLQDTAGISTRSEGSGLYRKLLIIPSEAEAR
jgi:spoIIIJ-associated protein